ncbi:CPBP family intramembrane metalloprotease [Legionella sp. PATHC035]|uniref:CPBP family intramembrane metalloprotease n=1 Tax=Legionella sp. PATHC035 TaxID=2992040 RepID=UPI002243AD54|nr:CPBP family intramembrane metalloprotease [Legionella sp. PATHC035]MCW8409760.1 CPBP family intramembrane metalloprotease [Legionella sp. PATHC035]
MTINWPLITVLFCLSIPGVLIAIKRLIFFLLPDNSEALKKRISYFAIVQTLLMVFILSLAGAILSPMTGLHDALLEGLLQGTTHVKALLPIMLPTVFYAFFGLLVFLALLYGLIARIIDKKNMQIMANIRTVLGVDGCVLYGGVVEEVIGRWGLLNLATFFALLFTKQFPNLLIWISIVISGLIYAVSQIPIYLAAGCTRSRRFIYSVIILSLYQSVLFGYLFWQYGLIAAILSHMLFHLGWAAFENVKRS